MALEVHVNTRDQNDPCYKYDAVAAVFMVIHNESAQLYDHLNSIQGGDAIPNYRKANLLIINRKESQII